VDQIAMARFSTQSEPKLSVILVADLEDFSLWCPTVEPSVVGCLSERFFESANLLLEIFDGNFLKSTGDGIIAIWDHPFSPENPSLNLDDADTVVRSIEQASTMAVALQIFLFLRFGLSWSTPRFLRCALHIGVLRRTCFTRTREASQIDYVGEPLNAACRLQQYGRDVHGPVVTQHVQSLLSVQREDTLVGIVLPEHLLEASKPKGAEWIAKQLFYLPSVELLGAGQQREPDDDMLDALDAVTKNMAIFTFRYMKALDYLYPGNLPLTSEQMMHVFPRWMKILPSYFESFLRTVNFTIDERIVNSFIEGFKSGLIRWLSEKRRWQLSSQEELESEVDSVLKEAAERFPPLARLFLDSDAR
jgi:class 3 adenylate cyclase